MRTQSVTGAAYPLSLAALLLGLVSCQSSDGGEGAAALDLPPGAHEAAAQINVDGLATAIRDLAADEMEGRGPGSRGDTQARQYIAAVLEAAGLEPGGPDGGWEQPFELVGITAEIPDAWTFATGEASLSLERWDEFIAGSGVQSEAATIEDAEIVFVGYGIVAPEYDWDDFKGAELRGKVLLMLNNDPDWDPELFEGERRLYYGRWTYKYESAARQGAAGAIVMHTTPSAGYPFQVVQSSWTGEQFELPAGAEPRVQVAAWTTEEATRRLAELAGHDLDALIEAAKERSFSPVPLGVRTSLTLRNRIRRVETANVLALLPGSDPELADEVVVYTAHHDHLGIGEPNEAGDAIYNGARDNASGASVVLAIAEAFTNLPQSPRRSVLFNLVAAEEQGLLGSRYYSQQPTFPPGRIAANINYDIANIWGLTRDITYIGYGKSSLDRVIDAVAGMQERRVRGDQFPDRGRFYRSDQLNFARIGVPALYLKPGTDFVGRPGGWGREQRVAYERTDYHQPSDEFREEWNLEGMVQDAQLGFYCGLAIAQETELPSWRPGDEFEAARLAALEAVGD